jgi:hypothetical protein
MFKIGSLHRFIANHHFFIQNVKNYFYEIHKFIKNEKKQIKAFQNMIQNA